MMAPHPWSPITQTLANLEKLRLLCNSEKERKQEGYILDNLDDREMSYKSRCQACHRE
jgi:hypothetical protein